MVAIIVNRRALVTSILSSTLCSSSVLIQDVANFIATSTPRAFREAVAHEGTPFLYRGEEPSTITRTMAGHVCSPRPDLLLEETYHDIKALEYFKCLEEYLAFQQTAAKPSTGHIGTSNKADARQWGNVVSTWPLGTEISFVYPKKKQKFVTPTLDSFCREEEFGVNENLETALQEGREVLFASWYGSNTTIPTSSFLAVPQVYDKRLKELLVSMNYGF